MHIGDKVSAQIYPETIIGAITADVAINQTVVNVSSTVLDNIEVGFRCYLFDGVNQDNCGKVIDVDKTNSQITLSPGAVYFNYSAASPTYVQMSIEMFSEMEIPREGIYNFGDSTIGGSYLPAGTPGRIIYENISGGVKRFVMYVEYLY